MGYTHGIRWSDELIKEKVLEVVNALGLDRMPSRAECEMYYHNTALANAVTRRKRWYNLADELGLEVKRSETFFGKSYEAKASEKLMALGYDVRRMSENFPYDILVDGCVKVDVKASRLYHGKSGNFYTYNIDKPFATCDFYVLYAVSDNGDEREIVVPSKDVFSNTQITIGEHKSKYDKFQDAWWLIWDAVLYWESVV